MTSDVYERVIFPKSGRGVELDWRWSDGRFRFESTLSLDRENCGPAETYYWQTRRGLRHSDFAQKIAHGFTDLRTGVFKTNDADLREIGIPEYVRAQMMARRIAWILKHRWYY